MQNIFIFHLIHSKNIYYLLNAYSMVTQILYLKNIQLCLEVNF